MNEPATRVFKALAHPARIKMIRMLSESDRSVKELTSAFAMSQPAVSQHLRELRNARLVASQKAGSQQLYRLKGEPLKIVFDWCSRYRRFFDPAGHAWQLTSTDAAAPSATRKGGSRHGR